MAHITVPHIITLITVCIGVYIIASINFSILTARFLMGEDIRKTGSKNAGATNLMRLAGIKTALLVLFSDILRAYGLMLILKWSHSYTEWPFGAIIILAGNIFPIFHSFKGGKGIAATIGIFLAVQPITAVIGIAIFVTTVAICKRVSPASLTMVLSVLLLQTGDYLKIWHIYDNVTLKTVVTTLIIMIIVIWTHRVNIKRLLKKQEPSIFKQK